MSPKRLEATTTSSESGAVANRAASASTWYFVSSTSGWRAATSRHTSSHRGMAYAHALDFVALASRRRGLRSAIANAYSTIRSIPLRENTPVWTATSSSWPRWTCPPTFAYSPSEFSLTTTMSRSPGPRSRRGLCTPGRSLIGRRLTYWRKLWRMGMISPQTATWSGTSGLPIAPSMIASCPSRTSSASGGIMRPSLA